MLDALAKSWLFLQCQMIPSVNRGLVSLRTPASGSMEPAAVWPESSGATTSMINLAELALARQSPVVKAHAGGGGRFDVACPMSVAGHPGAVVVVEVNGSSDQQHAIIQLLRWGASWLEFLAERESSAVSSRLLTLVQVVATSLEHEHFPAATSAAATALALALGAERVAIGFRTRSRTRVQALSGSARFDESSALMRRLGAAMDEALDQDATISLPARAGATPRVVRAHAALAGAPGSDSVCTVVFRSGDGRGAITFERGPEGVFDGAAVELCEAVAALLGPILEIKRRDDQGLGARAMSRLGGHLARLIGPRHLGLKLATAAAVTMLAFLCLADGQHRVTAEASIETLLKRAVVVPQDGFLAEVGARAGDIVHRDDLLASLDDRDLKLAQVKWSSQRAKLDKEYRQALAAGKRSESRIAKAQIAEAEAELDLVDAQLLRVRMTAPFDGVIVSGDLDQSLGAPVARGDVLFEVAPLASQRVVLAVDERDVADVRPGQTGSLALTALPGESLALTVKRVMPVSVAAGGRNIFRVEAMMARPDEGVRPGMAGIAKLDAGSRRLAWIWAHELLARVRLQLWAWVP